MNEEASEIFLSLIYSLSNAAMMQLGKLPNPVSGKTEKNLEQAKSTIDLLRILKDKTKGNLTKREEEFLINILTNLELNFADETK